jgi:hypothetical protein
MTSKSCTVCATGRATRIGLTSAKCGAKRSALTSDLCSSSRVGTPAQRADLLGNPSEGRLAMAVLDTESQVL